VAKQMVRDRLPEFIIRYSEQKNEEADFDLRNAKTNHDVRKEGTFVMVGVGWSSAPEMLDV
jgi:hypothetical protein